MEKVDCIVVGPGAVGLAVARALALAMQEVIVLEAQDCIGSEMSSRNSEVIHAGIYYSTGSLKALFCVQGRKQLCYYCDEHYEPYKQCGKYIIATSDLQQSQLQAILENFQANNVNDIISIDKSEMQRKEPNIQCVSALWSPFTGIIDSHAYMLALQGDLEDAGALSCLTQQSPVELWLANW